MKKRILLFLISTAIISCSTKPKKPQKNPEPRDISPYVVYENELLTNNIDNAIIENVEFDAFGGSFYGTEQDPSYIKIPFSALNNNQSFNISFDFLTTSDDGTVAQGLISLIDDFSSPTNAPLIISYTGRRVSGAIGRNVLWAQEYDYKKGMSSQYYDLFQLNSNTTYNVVLNYNEGEAAFYINNELYATYKGVERNTMQGKYILIGALPSGNAYNYFLNGKVSNLRILNTHLLISEITPET